MAVFALLLRYFYFLNVKNRLAFCKKLSSMVLHDFIRLSLDEETIKISERPNLRKVLTRVFWCMYLSAELVNL